MRRILAGLLWALLAAGLYVAYAAYSIGDLVDGFRKGDADQIAAHVDFPSVRAGLKEQITAAMMQSAMKEKDGGGLGTAFVAAFGPTMVGNMVDSMVTPSGLRTMMQNRAGDGDLTKRFDLSTFLDHLTIISPTQIKISDPKSAALRLAFQDLTWKLVEVRLSDDALRDAAAKK